jgi:hypothetical protein
MPKLCIKHGIKTLYKNTVYMYYFPILYHYVFEALKDGIPFAA